MGAPFVGEALKFLKDPFTFTLTRTRQHGNVWRTRILGDTVVFFAGPKAFSFFMDPEHFTRQSGSPRFMQELLHPDAVPFLDGDRHKARKRLLLAAFTDPALEGYLPGIFTIFDRFAAAWTGDPAERTVGPELAREQARQFVFEALSFVVGEGQVVRIGAGRDCLRPQETARAQQDRASQGKGRFHHWAAITPQGLPPRLTVR